MTETNACLRRPEACLGEKASG